MNQNTVNNIGTAVDLLVGLLPAVNQFAAIGQAVATARAQGRDMTPEELQPFIDADNAAKAQLDRDIAALGG